MADLKWDGPNALQIDSWATGQQRALAMLHNGKITIEVTNGGDWWRVEIPAPWVKPPAVEVPKHADCPYEFRVGQCRCTTRCMYAPRNAGVALPDGSQRDA